MLDRVKIRLNDNKVNDNLLQELITTATDRINLRLGVSELPSEFNSICVDIVVKLYRRMYYEGISSESADTLNTSFIENVLAEYKEEFDPYIRNKDLKSQKVRFI